ncbi:CynX/NimT family MFS transporter [Azospirillum sp.]|uniref:MFS transporter n=1 Tax=Azospirillum sp. TaxID=34012 RepID=UPI003D75794A
MTGHAAGRTAWAAVASAIGIGIAAAMSIGKVPPAMPLIRSELGLSLVEGGWVMSVFATLGATAGVALGLLSDSIGQRRGIWLGVAALLLGGVLGAMAGSGTLLLLARVVEGVGFIFVTVSAPSLILAATAPADRSFAFGLWSIYMPSGSAIAMVLAAGALPLVGWRGLWLGLLALLLLATLVLTLTTRHLPVTARSTQHPVRLIAETTGRPGLWGFALAFTAYAFQWISLMVWLPSFLMQDRGLSGTAATLLTALLVLANVPGCILGGWLMRKAVPRGWLLATASAVMALSAPLAVAGVGPDGFRYALCLLFSFAGGMLPAASFSGAAAHAPSPKHLASANGMVLQGSNLGQLLGPPLIAQIVSQAGGDWQAATVTLAVAAACAASLGLMVVRMEGGKAARRTA